jgi:hydrogenase maturation protease
VRAVRDRRSSLVVGVGQAYAGDDGVGREVAKRLGEAGVETETVDDGSGLLNHLLDASRDAIVIDAVVGGGAPGTLCILREDELERGPRPVSSHGLSVAHAIALARRFNPDLKVCLVGISIESPPADRKGLSPDVAASVSGAVDWVVAALGAE